MNDWNNPIDYWDFNKKAVLRNTLRLHKLGETDRKMDCDQIRDKVRMYAEQLSDEQLLQMVITMVDDLYKSVNDEVLLAPTLYEYIDAFGRTLTQVVRERGYIIQYVVDNQFLDTDLLLRGPIDMFSKVFKAAGFVYICPQQMSLMLMQADGIDASEYPGQIGRYIAEGRYLGNSLVTECIEENRHYVFLEADYQEGALDLAMQGSGSPGVLNIFRNEAPIAGSKIGFTFPEQKLGD